MKTRHAALTGDGGAIPLRIWHQQLVLEATPAHPLCPDQNQALPTEGGHLGNFLVDKQLVPIKLWKTEQSPLITRPDHPHRSLESCIQTAIYLSSGKSVMLEYIFARLHRRLWARTSILGCQVHHLLFLLPTNARTEWTWQRELRFVRAKTHTTMQEWKSCSVRLWFITPVTRLQVAKALQCHIYIASVTWLLH